MKHFILANKPDKNNIIRLEGSDYHYLVRVRRLAVGEYFPALLPPDAKYPAGNEVLVLVQSVDDKVLVGKCIENKDCGVSGDNVLSLDAKTGKISPQSAGQYAGVSMPAIILFQSLPKGDKMDLIVRQAAEGALAEIVPFVSEFSVVKGKAKSKNSATAIKASTASGIGGQKIARWERIIKEARQQSGSVIATKVRQPLSMDELFEYWNELKLQGQENQSIAQGVMQGVLGLFFHHLPLEQASLHSYLDKKAQIVVLVIGPEGGFSNAEAARFLEAGFRPLTIGDTVLRTETAALYGAAAIRTILLERNSWELKQI